MAKQNVVNWQVEALEHRVLLAGDVGAAVSATVDSPSDVEVSGQVQDHSQPAGAVTVVFVDGTLDQADQLVDAIGDGADIVLLDNQRDVIGQITDSLQSRSGVQRVGIVSHGGDGELVVAGQRIDQQTIERNAEQVRMWQASLGDDADVLLYGCNVAQGAVGRSFVQCLAKLTGADVAASVDVTGNSARGADWELEYKIGSVSRPNLFCEARLSKFQQTLDFVVHAWGQTGDEQVAVLINEETAGVFTLGQQYQAFRIDTEDGVTADQVRIRFLNDEYRPEDNYDRNALIESIQIDGTFFETESVSVLSSGTWRAQDGIRTGFGRGEVLHTNGEFQFGTDVPRGGSRLEITARGETGDERFSLSIGGQFIGDFDTTTHDQTYVYQTESPITADDVRIEFLNDFYDPGVWDNNLIVDKIAIDGNVFETESPSVFSSGTWRAEDGVVSGFRESETLHTNGFFEYSQDGSGTRIEVDGAFGDNGVVRFAERSRHFLPSPDGGFFRTEGGLIQKFRSDYQLDVSFGDGGVAALPNSGSIAVAQIDQLPDGSLVALSLNGSTLDNYTIHRLSSSGEYLGGVAADDLVDGSLTRFGGGPRLAVTSEGKIILGGGKDNSDVAVFASLNDDLTPNTGFGVGGRLELSGLIGSFDSVSGIVVTEDGGFLTYQSRLGSLEGQRGRSVIKITASGQADRSFGNNGVSELIPVDNLAQVLSGLSLDSQGRLVALSGTRFVRWTPTGQLDDTFGDQGLAVLDLEPVVIDSDRTVTLQSGVFGIDHQDRLIVSRGVLVSLPSRPPLELGVLFGRLNEDGTSDTALGAEFIPADSGQAVSASVSTPGAQIIVDDDGGIVVVGALAGGIALDPAVARYLIV